MKKVLLSLFCLLALGISISVATPPVSITLTYDLSKGSLHVVAVHPSFDLEKSYVRLMNVYVNGNQITSLNYFKQGDYNEFTDDVPLTAQVGDVIKVDLFCSLGGEMAQELTVTQPTAEQSGQNTDAVTNNSTTNSSTNSVTINTAS